MQLALNGKLGELVQVQEVFFLVKEALREILSGDLDTLVGVGGKVGIHGVDSARFRVLLGGGRRDGELLVLFWGALHVGGAGVVLGRIGAARNVIQKCLPTKAVRLFGVVEMTGPAKRGHALKLLVLQAWRVEVVLLVLVLLVLLVARENVAHQVTASRDPLGQFGRAPRVPEPRCEGEALVETALARLQRGPVRGGVYLPFRGHGCPDALLERIAARALERQKLR